MSDIFETDKTFKDLGLSDSVLQGVERGGFEHPTAIQAQLLPAILSGKDVIGQAKTGTGKTAAFGLPILSLADENVAMQALVLTPTRELASQVAGEIEELGHFTPIRTTCIIGGESMLRQKQSLERGGHIIVGTPGRIMDMQARRQIHFNNLKFVVLDEVDRMLDIGFRDDIRKILRSVKQAHQTIFVSATIDNEIERLGRTFMKDDALKLMSASKSLTVSLVEQKFMSVEPWDKRTLLLHLIRHEKPQTTVVFCRTKMTVQKVAVYLRDKGINAREIHGDLHQSKRNKVMQAMRGGETDVLIASDLAARGLDIEHITHVINYDLPEDPEVYVHRIGRTARAGRKGEAWAFVTPEEGKRLTDIEKLTGVLIEDMNYTGFKPGPIPRGVLEEREQAASSAPAQKPADRAKPAETNELTEEQIKTMFPDGRIPKNVPTKTMGRRLRSRRNR
jgi:ATP-dependent RNA helicase DeaD